MQVTPVSKATFNTSGIEPRGHAVLIRMVELEELKTKLVQIPDHVRTSASVMEQRGIVIAVGEAAWDEEKEPRACVGDKVIVTRAAGYVVKGTWDGQLYRLVNDRDIFAVITKERDRG